MLRKDEEDLIDGFKFYENQARDLGDYFLDSIFSDIESLRIYAGMHALHFGYHRILSQDAKLPAPVKIPVRNLYYIITSVREMNETQWDMKPNKAKAIMLAKRQLPEFVCDAVNLEGINLTLPEIQTLLDGITVGGHKLSDQQIALNQADTWRALFRLIDQNQFEITCEKVCALHLIAGKDEALEWGQFRSGGVTIAGTDYMPPQADSLPELFEKMVNDSYSIPDIYDRAIHFFLTMARCQFFYDVNKRMGRFIMNGLLLNCGYPAINLPAKRQLEFNQLMLDFYETGNQKPMNTFLRSCLDEKIIKIMKESCIIK